MTLPAGWEELSVPGSAEIADVSGRILLRVDLAAGMTGAGTRSGDSRTFDAKVDAGSLPDGLLFLRLRLQGRAMVVPIIAL